MRKKQEGISGTRVWLKVILVLFICGLATVIALAVFLSIRYEANYVEGKEEALKITEKLGVVIDFVKEEKVETHLVLVKDEFYGDCRIFVYGKGHYTDNKRCADHLYKYKLCEENCLGLDRDGWQCIAEYKPFDAEATAKMAELRKLLHDTGVNSRDLSSTWDLGGNLEKITFFYETVTIIPVFWYARGFILDYYEEAVTQEMLDAYPVTNAFELELLGDHWVIRWDNLDWP